MSDSAVGCEFNVNASTVPYNQKRETDLKKKKKTTINNVAVKLKDK